MTRPFPVPCSLAIAAGYVAGIASYATLPGPYLTAKLSPFTRLAIAFLLPTTGLVVCWLLAALWTRDPVRRGNGALEQTFDAIRFRIVLFLTALHGLILANLAGVLPVRAAAGRSVLILFGIL